MKIPLKSFAVPIPEMHVPSMPTPTRGGPLSSRGGPGFGNFGPGFSPGAGLQTSRARASYLGFPAVNDGKTVEPAVVIAQDKLQELTSDVSFQHFCILSILMLRFSDCFGPLKIHPSRTLPLFVRCI